MKLFRIAALCLFIVAAVICSSKPPFLKVFMDTYKVNPNSKLGQARCMICHQPPAPPIRNKYGQQVQAALEAAHARMVTPEILKSIELKSSGDSISNIAKIKSGSLPGDVKVNPKTPKVKGKKGQKKRPGH